MSEETAPKKAHNHWFHIPAQVIVIGFCVYWYFVPPVPSKAVLVLTGVTVVMALLDMRPEHKAAYLLLVFFLMFIENRAIDRDHTAALKAEGDRQKDENSRFNEIVNGLKAAIQQSQNQFEETTGRVNRLLDKTQSLSNLTESNLRNITGGESFAFVRPQVEGGGKGPIGLVVWNHGNEVLTGVTIGFSRLNDPNWGNEFFNRYTLGTIAPHDVAMIPVTITPQLDTNGIDSYWLMISAQNGTVDENIGFRESKKFPGTYAVRLTVTKRFKLANNASASIPVFAREWSDEGGADIKLPSVHHTLETTRRNIKKAAPK